MMIQKSRLCSEEIGYFVDRWVWSLVGDLENVWQAADDYVGRLFPVELNTLAAEKAKIK